jgi:predicted GIY-YIG superfamily endonuclease
VAHYWVYMLRCADGSLYTGCTIDLERRLVEHGTGRASKYTRVRLPVALAYAEPSLGRGAALRRELEIKRLSRNAKQELCSRWEGQGSR